MQKVLLFLVFNTLLFVFLIFLYFVFLGNELRPDSFSGGMDLYGEQRHSYRSRSGMESPRSPINFQHKYVWGFYCYSLSGTVEITESLSFYC